MFKIKSFFSIHFHRPFSNNPDSSISVRNDRSFEATHNKYFLTPMASDNFPESFKKTMATISLIIGEKKSKKRSIKRRRVAKTKNLR